MYSEATLSLLRTFKEPISGILGSAKDEIKFLIDDGLPSYIESYKSKFEEVKTFLFRDEKVKFYDAFYNVKLKYKTERFKIEHVEDLYRAGTCVSIIGIAGSGKSMLMKHVFLRAIYQKVKIPIFIELKNLNDYKGDLIQFIYDKILNNGLSPSSNIVERLLASGSFLFLFDGYDEIYSENKNKITQDLEEFIDLNSQNWFLITSRPGAGIKSFPRFNNCYVQHLDDKEINEFIENQCKIINDDELSKTIISKISDPKNSVYKNYLRNPLFLSMFLFTYRNFPELPSKRSRFYWNVLDTLLTKHDSFTKKGGWQHERESGLQNEEIEITLQRFCYSSYFQGAFQFNEDYLKSNLGNIKKSFSIKFEVDKLIYDLEVNINILQKDGLVYLFPHRSLQEYLAAKLISVQNDKNKEVIYSEKLARFSEKTIGGDANFWRLCEELDNEGYLKYLVLPNLSEYINDFSGKEPKQILFRFFEITNFVYHIEYAKGKLTSTGKTLNHHIYYSLLRITSNIDFLSLGDESINNLLNGESALKNILMKEAVGKIVRFNFDPSLYVEDYWEDLMKIGLIDELESVLEKVEIFHDQCLEQLKKSEENGNKLLGLI